MKKFGRSSKNRVVFGLCGGIGEYLNLDPTIIRIAFLAMNFFMPGWLFLVYIVAGVVLPIAPEEEVTISPEPQKPFMSFESDGFDIKNAQDVEVKSAGKSTAEHDEAEYFKQSRNNDDFK